MSTAAIVNAWFREKLATGPLGRDTPAYNQAFRALPDLIARLDAAAPAPPAPKAKAAAAEPAAEQEA